MASVEYIRVSSTSRNTDRQVAGVELDEVFQEMASAKDAKRPVVQNCLRYLRDDDTLHVHSMDRLARNLFDLQPLLGEPTGRDVAVHFHKEHLTFTGDESPMAILLLHVMGAIAPFECALIRDRQREGIAERSFSHHARRPSGFAGDCAPGTGARRHFRTLGSTIEHTRYPPLFTVVIWPDPCQDPGE